MENRDWIELIFLPPNTTSHTQLMDQGVFRAPTAKNRSLAVCKLTLTLEKKEPIPTISTLSALSILSILYDHVGKDAEYCLKQDCHL